MLFFHVWNFSVVLEASAAFESTSYSIAGRLVTLFLLPLLFSYIGTLFTVNEEERLSFSLLLC